MRHTQTMIYCDGIPLSAVGADLVVSSVQEGAVSQTQTATSLGRAWGQHIDTLEDRTKDIVLTFAVARPRGLEQRAMLVDELIRWASGDRTIKLSYKPDRHLNCTCITLPTIADLYKWTNTMAVTWRAYDVPYWVADQASKSSMTVTANTPKSQFVANVGTVQTPLVVSFTPTSTLHAIYFGDGTNTIGVTGLNVSAGQPLTLGVDASDRLTVKAGNTSLLAHVTSDSADMLTIKAGGQPISINSDAAGTATFSSTARWY